MAGRTRWSVLLQLCALAVARVALADPHLELENWIVANGGWMNTSIGVNELGVRGLFSKVHAEAGDHIAEIPNAVMLNAGSLDSNILAGTLAVLRELYDPHSRFKPYIKVWPKPDEIMNVCNFDLKYLYMLESDYWEKHVHSTQGFLQASLAGQVNHDLEYTIPEAVGNVTVPLADLEYACAVASTRYVTEEKRRRLMMIPVFDMSNHRRDCPHTTTALEGGDSVFIVLGDDVVPGEELCYPYTDTMRDDYAVMNYGFLTESEEPPRLLEIDHYQFKPDSDNQNLSEDHFDGEEEELEAEIKRQSATLDRLLELDKIRPEGPAPGSDWRYDMLAELQVRRRAALKHEIDRLKQELKEMRDID